MFPKGADVNRMHGTLKPLHCACMVADADCVELLLEKGAEVRLYIVHTYTTLQHIIVAFWNFQFLICNELKVQVVEGKFNFIKTSYPYDRRYSGAL